MNKLITLEEMRGAVRRAVDERGRDFVYPWQWMRHPPLCDTPCCVYKNKDGTPSCIVGLAVSYLRPNVVLREFEAAHEVLPGLADDDATWYAQKAQGIQDQGGTWGEALDAAEGSICEANGERSIQS